MRDGKEPGRLGDFSKDILDLLARHRFNEI